MINPDEEVHPRPDAEAIPRFDPQGRYDRSANFASRAEGQTCIVVRSAS
jgi:hypothetical protein